MQSVFVHVLEHVHCRLTKSTQYVKKVEALRGQHGGHLQGQEEVILSEMFDFRISLLHQQYLDWASKQALSPSIATKTKNQIYIPVNLAP